jgi:hypothetical protein
VLELLAVVPFLCAVPSLFHELAHSTLLHSKAPDAVDVSLGMSEVLPAMAIVPFMIYQLAGFGTLHFVVRKLVNWVINIAILVLIMASYAANRQGDYGLERRFVAALVVSMAITVFYGVRKLRQMQEDYDLRHPQKEKEPK